MPISERADTPVSDDLQFSNEPDYSDPIADDFDALSRDRVLVRSLAPGDFDRVVAIDRKITGRDRGAFFNRKFAEGLYESGVRLSLVAEMEGIAVGFMMARVDFGEFGRTASEAVIDVLGVDEAYRSRQVGHALMSQLLANLASLQVDTVRTEVQWNDFGLMMFLDHCRFEPSQWLGLTCTLDNPWQSV
jgi:GNAT superfamily N-acetyltransferase